jgi:hypothetical protein
MPLIMLFLLAASDGAAETAIASAATAPTDKSLVKEFMRTPLS